MQAVVSDEFSYPTFLGDKTILCIFFRKQGAINCLDSSDNFHVIHVYFKVYRVKANATVSWGILGNPIQGRVKFILHSFVIFARYNILNVYSLWLPVTQKGHDEGLLIHPGYPKPVWIFDSSLLRSSSTHNTRFLFWLSAVGCPLSSLSLFVVYRRSSKVYVSSLFDK